jgi:hypothetical protein
MGVLTELHDRTGRRRMTNVAGQGNYLTELLCLYALVSGKTQNGVSGRVEHLFDVVFPQRICIFLLSTAAPKRDSALPVANTSCLGTLEIASSLCSSQ